MATKIVTKNSSTASAVPTASDLVQGELAVNVADKRLFTEDNGGAIVELGTNPLGAVTMASTLGVTGVLTANAGVKVDNFTLDGTTLALSSGDLTLDASGDIILDADDEGKVNFKDGGTQYARIDNNGGTGLDFVSTISDGDIRFRGNDGGSTIEALSLDMSAAGAATFNAGATFGGTATVVGTTTSGILLKSSSGASNGFKLYNDSGTDTAHLNNHFSGSMVFSTNNTERMRIDSSGRVGIGTASPNTGYALDVSGAIPAVMTSTSTATTPMYGGLGVKRETNTNGNGTGIGFLLEDAGDVETEYAYIGGIIESNTAGSEDGGLVIATTLNNVRTQRMRIDSSGNVGIGTSSPSQPLHVSKGGTNVGAVAYDVAVFQNSDAAGIRLVDAGDGDGNGGHSGLGNDNGNLRVSSAGVMTFATGLSTSDSLYNGGTERLRIDSSGNVGIGVSTPSNNHANANNLVVGNGTAGGIANYVGTGTGWYAFSRANANNSDAYDGGISYDGSRNLMFHTNAGTERMRIDSSGLLQIATTGKTGRLNLQPNPSNNHFVEFYTTADGKVGEINTTGGTTTNYVTSSDQRLKENIADADDAGSKVDAIQVRKFDWKANGSHQDYGMIAQELQTVAPEAVSGDADSEEMMGVDYSKLVPMLIKEIQSLRNRVAQLEE